ncbi:MAG: YIP1 family protein [Chloroflexi bacterium]|nr:YIP1 family protein [Chloroflexota bacterium]
MLLQMLRAAILDGRVYSELAEQPSYVLRSFIIVGAAAVAFGVSLRSIEFAGLDESSGFLGFLGMANLAMILGVATIFVSWVVWAGFAFLLGTRLFRGRAGFRALLRSMGLAYGPGLLFVLAPLPVVGAMIFNVTLLWLLATNTVAVRYTQGYDWARAVVASGVGWVVALFLIPSFIFQPAA